MQVAVADQAEQLAARLTLQRVRLLEEITEEAQHQTQPRTLGQVRAADIQVLVAAVTAVAVSLLLTLDWLLLQLQARQLCRELFTLSQLLERSHSDGTLCRDS
jgi:hypothetical protein